MPRLNQFDPLDLEIELSVFGELLQKCQCSKAIQLNLTSRGSRDDLNSHSGYLRILRTALHVLQQNKYDNFSQNESAYKVEPKGVDVPKLNWFNKNWDPEVRLWVRIHFRAMFACSIWLQHGCPLIYENIKHSLLLGTGQTHDLVYIHMYESSSLVPSMQTCRVYTYSII